MHEKRYCTILATRQEVLVVVRYPRLSWELPLVSIFVNDRRFWTPLATHIGTRYDDIDELIEAAIRTREPEPPEVDWDSIPTLPMTSRTWAEATAALNDEESKQWH